jgi:hypothetical protein
MFLVEGCVLVWGRRLAYTQIEANAQMALDLKTLLTILVFSYDYDYALEHPHYLIYSSSLVGF